MSEKDGRNLEEEIAELARKAGIPEEEASRMKREARRVVTNTGIFRSGKDHVEGPLYDMLAQFDYESDAALPEQIRDALKSNDMITGCGNTSGASLDLLKVPLLYASDKVRDRLVASGKFKDSDPVAELKVHREGVDSIYYDLDTGEKFS